MSHGMSRLQVERLREWGKEVDVQYMNRVKGRTSKADELYELARLWANGGTGDIRTNAHALFLLELEEALTERDAVLRQALEALECAKDGWMNSQAIAAIKGILNEPVKP